MHRKIGLLSVLRVDRKNAGTSIRNTFLLAIMAALAACESGFSQADIDTTKSSIKSEFEKNAGVKVVEIRLIRESPKKLSGFVKLKVTILGNETDVMKSCSATLGDGREYLWQCE